MDRAAKAAKAAKSHETQGQIKQPLKKGNNKLVVYFSSNPCEKLVVLSHYVASGPRIQCDPFQIEIPKHAVGGIPENMNLCTFLSFAKTLTVRGILRLDVLTLAAFGCVQRAKTN